MRLSTSAIAVSALGASSALAQLSITSVLGTAESYLAMLSPSCQATVISLASPSAPAYQCLQVQNIIPIILSNASIVPGIDSYLSSICSSAPCSNGTLYNLTQSITSGCSSDLSKYGITNTTIAEIIGTYPLAREVACLKTSAPFNGTNATIPISNSTYNTTNGTFCATSLLTEVSAYLGANLTNSFIDNAVLSGNTTILNMLEMIPPTALCNDCIFAALDLIEDEFPQVGSVPISANVTLNSYLNGTCNATGYVVSTNGTLPSTIIESAINSTLGFNITVGNVTIAPMNGTQPGPSTINITIRGEPAMKKRWFGKV